MTNEVGGLRALWRKEGCLQGVDGESWRKETTWGVGPRHSWEDNMKMYLKK